MLLDPKTLEAIIPGCHAKEYFAEISGPGALSREMLKLAEHILRSKATDFDPSRFVDHYEEAVVEMLKKKQAGIVVSPP